MISIHRNFAVFWLTTFIIGNTNESVTTTTAFLTTLPPSSPFMKLNWQSVTKETNHNRNSRHPSQSSSPTQQQGLCMSVPNTIDVFTSGMASIFCLPRGVTVSSPKQDSEDTTTTRIVKLYDIENSRTCRPVRERITELDLVVDQVIPVAVGSKNSLPTGTSKVPVLVASKTEDKDKKDVEVTIEGTDDILKFLDESFADQSSKSTISQGGDNNDTATVAKEYLQTAGIYLAGWMRLGRGNEVSPSVSTVNRPEKPLVLYSYEGNQFCRVVREVLTELDIVYELRSAGKESPRRAELSSITGGSSQCPYLIDPNTGVSMPESADIIEYLYKTYALWTPPSELLEWISNNVMSLAKPVFGFLAPLQAGEKDADSNFQTNLKEAIQAIKEETSTDAVVVYTYELSPFSSETKNVLDRLNVDYKEISLGKEWLPGLIAEGGAIKRAALLEMTGQSSLPHIFINGKAIGGLFSGSPGLLSTLKNGDFPNNIVKKD